MQAKPLQYESLKAVLQYMNPNLRFQLSHRCPSIRITEKLVPLKINSLSLGKSRTTVNDTTYQVAVYFDYPPGKAIPPDHDKPGGVPNDVDQYGISDFTDQKMRTRLPGDTEVSTTMYRRWPTHQFNVDYDRYYRPERWYKMKLREFEEISNKLRQRPDQHSIEYQEKLASTEEQIDYYRRNLLPYEHQRRRIAPVHTSFIHLNVTSDNKKTTERVMYNKKLYEAWKLLNNFLFGKRPSRVLVNKLTITLDGNEKVIFRFPENFKIQILNEFESDLFVFHFLRSVIDDSNYSSIHLILKNSHFDLYTYRQRQIAEAKVLILDDVDGYEECPYYETLTRLVNQTVFILGGSEQMDQIRLVRDWLENGKDIGVFYSFGIRTEQTARMRLQRLATEFARRVTRNQGRSVTFSMPSGNSQLRAYYERILPRPIGRRDEQAYWNLVLKVEFVG